MDIKSMKDNNYHTWIMIKSTGETQSLTENKIFGGPLE